MMPASYRQEKFSRPKSGHEPEKALRVLRKDLCSHIVVEVEGGELLKQIGGGKHREVGTEEKLVGESLDENRQHALIDEFFSGVKSGKIVMMDDASASGASAVVTSALPLTPAEQDTVKKDVLAKTGAQAVTFRVDPAILGGLVIKIGDKVLDGSVSGKLEGLRSNLH